MQEELDLVAALYIPRTDEYEDKARYVFELLKPADFTDQRCAAVFDAMQRCQRFGLPSDTLVMLKKSEIINLPMADWIMWLSELKDRYVNHTHIKHLTRNVYRKSRIRDLSKKFSYLADDLANVNFAMTDERGALLGLPELEGEAATMIQSIEPPDIRRGTQDVAADIVEDSLAGKSPDKLKTGIYQLDGLTSLVPGDSFVIGAAPSSGKTIVGCQIAMNAAMEGHPALIVSIEMDQPALIRRMLCNMGGLFMDSLDARHKSDAVKQKIRDAHEKIKKLPLEIEKGSSDIDVVCSTILRHVRDRKVRVVVVDYLQLIKIKKNRPDSRNAEITDISSTLKDLAHENNFTLILLSQLNRAGKDKPTLSSLRDSGAIEQDADEVMFLVKEGMSARFSLAKNRQGAIHDQESEWPKLDIDYPLFRVGHGKPASEDVFA